MKITIRLEGTEKQYTILSALEDLFGAKVISVDVTDVPQTSSEHKEEVEEVGGEKEEEEEDITGMVKLRISNYDLLENTMSKYGINLKENSNSYRKVKAITMSKNKEGEYLYRIYTGTPFDTGSLDVNVLKDSLCFWRLYGIPVETLKRGEPQFGKDTKIPTSLDVQEGIILVTSPYHYNDPNGKISEHFTSKLGSPQYSKQSKGRTQGVQELNTLIESVIEETS